eukprot:gene877-1098_t
MDVVKEEQKQQQQKQNDEEVEQINNNQHNNNHHNQHQTRHHYRNHHQQQQQHNNYNYYDDGENNFNNEEEEIEEEEEEDEYDRYRDSSDEDNEEEECNVTNYRIERVKTPVQQQQEYEKSCDPTPSRVKFNMEEHHYIFNKETLQYFPMNGHSNYQRGRDDSEEEEEEEEDEDDDENGSVISYEEHSDNNNNESSIPAFLQNYNPNEKQLSYRLRAHAKNKTIFSLQKKNIQDFIAESQKNENVLIEQQQQQQQKEEESTTIATVDDKELVDIINNNNNNNSNLPIGSESVDDQDENFKKIIEMRTKIEKDLEEFRRKSNLETKQLRDCYNQAKTDLNQKIEQLYSQQKQHHQQLKDGIFSFSDDNDHDGTDGNVNDNSEANSSMIISTSSNEIDDISKSLKELEYKINEMNQHSNVVDNQDENPIQSNTDTNNDGENSMEIITTNNTSSGRKNEINSLISDFTYLKEQIEKEKSEKVNRDRELQDITKHLLETASQLNNAIIFKSEFNDNSLTPTISNTTTTTTTNNFINNINNDESREKELEFCRKQIDLLEKRLSTWKHDNDMLHAEILTGKEKNSNEYLDFTTKIKKVEQERDRLYAKIEKLELDIGEGEERESVLTNVVTNLMNDKQKLSEALYDMQAERVASVDRFNSLITELRVMGENSVTKLKDIVSELTLEREELQNGIRDADNEREAMIIQLNLVRDQLHQSEEDKQKMSERISKTEDSNNQLLISAENTIKKLESSEIKCNHLQIQLQIVNRRLNWTESEVERLTKEMDRVSTNQTGNGVNGPVGNATGGGVGFSYDQSNKIRLSFDYMKAQVSSMKQLLSKERSEIIQLGSDLAEIVEKGKRNTSITINSLRDLIIKEVENTKVGLACKIAEIEEKEKQQIFYSQFDQRQQSITPASSSPSISIKNSDEDAIINPYNQQQQLSNDHQFLISELINQKSKLSEMQQKILKLENQISEITAENNNSNYDGDQVSQLKKMEYKIRKIEAGISGIIDSPSKSLTPSHSTTTITTTTTTHHYGSGQTEEDATGNGGSTPDSNYNNKRRLQQPPQQQKLITPGGDENNDHEDSISSVYFSTIKRVVTDTLVFGSNILFFRLMNTGDNIGSDIITTSNLQHSIISLCKSSLNYGLIISSVVGFTKLPLSYFNNEQQSTMNSVTTTATPTPLSSTTKLEYDKMGNLILTKNDNVEEIDEGPKNIKTRNGIKETLVCGLVGATVYGGILYFKQQKQPIYLLSGCIIGCLNVSSSCLNNCGSDQNKGICIYSYEDYSYKCACFAPWHGLDCSMYVEIELPPLEPTPEPTTTPTPSFNPEPTSTPTSSFNPEPSPTPTPSFNPVPTPKLDNNKPAEKTPETTIETTTNNSISQLKSINIPIFLVLFLISIVVTI